MLHDYMVCYHVVLAQVRAIHPRLLEATPQKG